MIYSIHHAEPDQFYTVNSVWTLSVNIVDNTADLEKNVISNFGGSIHAESEYGLGTKFIIILPTLKISSK